LLIFRAPQNITRLFFLFKLISNTKKHSLPYLNLNKKIETKDEKIFI